jgi:hypothetical protein
LREAEPRVDSAPVSFGGRAPLKLIFDTCDLVVGRKSLSPQKALVDCSAPEVFFGGARGGGKTDGVLGKWALKERRFGSNFNAVGFRRTSVSFEDAIDRAKQIYVLISIIDITYVFAFMSRLCRVRNHTTTPLVAGQCRELTGSVSTTLPMTSAGRLSPLGPVGISALA